ncbi:MAG TPA: hypothetical protein VN031_03470 [Candidatus Microsaccharimonas sp.]|nr:hypothetical protein [Candidatus Microsaccharimonas sp.]
MAESVAETGMSDGYDAFHRAVPGLDSLLSIEDEIVRSLCHDVSFGEQPSEEALAKIVLSSPYFLEPLPSAVKPAGFHGRSHDVEAYITPDVEDEFVRSLVRHKQVQYHRAVLLTVHAAASSSGLAEAGYYGADVLYFTRQVPRLGKAVTHFAGYDNDFPVKRRIAHVGWEEGSAFPVKQGQLAKMPNGINPVRKGGSGRARRHPKSR